MSGDLNGELRLWDLNSGVVSSSRFVLHGLIFTRVQANVSPLPKLATMVLLCSASFGWADLYLQLWVQILLCLALDL